MVGYTVLELDLVALINLASSSKKVKKKHMSNPVWAIILVLLHLFFICLHLSNYQPLGCPLVVLCSIN